MRIYIYIIYVFYIIFVFPFSNVQGQDFDDLFRLYRQARFSELLDLGNRNGAPDSALYLSNFEAIAYYELGKYDSAIPLFVHFLSKEGDKMEIQSYLDLASAYLVTGRQRAAFATLNKLIGLDRFGKDTLLSVFYRMVGEVYLNHEKFDSAIFYFDKSIDDSYTKCPYYFLARSYISIGKMDTGIKLLLKIDNIKSRNQLYSNLARVLFDSLNAIEHYKYSPSWPSETRWVMLERGDILYFFDDTSGWGIGSLDDYIRRHQEAYTEITGIFHTVLPRKLVYYVSRACDDTIHRNDIGHTDPTNCICFVCKEQTVGHEMTHALSNWGCGYRTINKKRLINEGVAVAFNMTNNNLLRSAQLTAVYYNNIHSILDLWDYFPENDSAVLINDRDFYIVAGGFIYYMQQKSSVEEFRNLVKDQTIENAEKIYGDQRFMQLITEFNERMDFR